MASNVCPDRAQLRARCAALPSWGEPRPREPLKFAAEANFREVSPRLSSDVAPYSAFDFVVVAASDLSTLACFRINSHCFRA
jgi:hypothetical protein